MKFPADRADPLLPVRNQPADRSPLPLLPQLLALHPGSHPRAWRAARRLPRRAPAAALPPLAPGRLRPGSGAPGTGVRLPQNGKARQMKPAKRSQRRHPAHNRTRRSTCGIDKTYHSGSISPAIAGAPMRQATPGSSAQTFHPEAPMPRHPFSPSFLAASVFCAATPALAALQPIAEAPLAGETEFRCQFNADNSTDCVSTYSFTILSRAAARCSRASIAATRRPTA